MIWHRKRFVTLSFLWHDRDLFYVCVNVSYDSLIVIEPKTCPYHVRSNWPRLTHPPYFWLIIEMPTFLYAINTLSPRRNRRHFADDIFKCIFVNDNVWISLKIWLKFVPRVPINNIPAMVQIMAWCRWLAYWRMHASLGLNELMQKLLDRGRSMWHTSWNMHMVLLLCFDMAWGPFVNMG